MKKISVHRFLYYSILFLIPMRTLTESMFGPLALYLKEVLILAILSILLIKSLVANNAEKILVKTIQSSGLIILYFFYIFTIALVSVLSGNNYMNAIVGFLTGGIYVLFGITTAYMCIENKEKTLRVIIIILSVAIVLNCIVAILEQFAPQFLPAGVASPERYGVFKRSAGLTGAQLHLGVFCASVIPFLCMAKFKCKSMVLVVGSICLFFTFSRGAWVQLAVGLCSLAILKKSNSSGIRINTRSILTAVGVLFVVFVLLNYSDDILPAFIARIDDIFDWSTETANVGRMSTWRSAWDIFTRHPISGIGIGTTGNNIRRLGLTTVLGVTESYYLKILVEQGIVGLFVFLPMLAYFIRLSYKKGKTTPLYLGICASLIGFSVELMILQSLESQIISGVFWMYIGISSARTPLLTADKTKEKVRCLRGADTNPLV